MSDPVTNPAHYDFSVSPLDAIYSWGLDFDLGNAIKYIARAGKKDPRKESEDLEKAIFYIRHHIKQITDQGGDSTC